MQNSNGYSIGDTATFTTVLQKTPLTFFWKLKTGLGNNEKRCNYERKGGHVANENAKMYTGLWIYTKPVQISKASLSIDFEIRDKLLPFYNYETHKKERMFTSEKAVQTGRNNLLCRVAECCLVYARVIA